MAYSIEAACYCKTGKVRKNNEDNFFFDGRCLEADNNGLHHPVTMEEALKNELCVAVFDGMGGENYGELASFAAAERMQSALQSINRNFFVSEKKTLKNLTFKVNEAVVEKAREMTTERMGSTMVALYFSHGYVYVCNVGDSRAYRLRNGEFMQLSQDHIEKRSDGKKAPLTQHLGLDPEEIQIEPHIARGDLKRGDQYLLCSDGLTDMLSNFEIDSIMCRTETADECVQQLIDAALENGGKDNVTAIVCRIK